MALYAIGDLHLSLGPADKPMDVFGGRWTGYMEKLRENLKVIGPEDTTVLLGDLSWAMSLDDAAEDFSFMNAIPGRKIILKGNHDYWWTTLRAFDRFCAEHGFSDFHVLNNSCFFYGELALCGTRGWFYEEDAAGTHTGKMLAREALRLEASFKAAGERPILCFLHYPPLYQGYRCPELLELIDRYSNVDYLDLFEALQADLPQLDIRAHRVDIYTGTVFDARMYYKRSREMLDPAVIDQLFPPERTIMTKAHDNPPAKYEAGSRVTNSIVSGGCHIMGTVADSILSRNVVVEPGATVRGCVIMTGCVIGRGARVENAIIDRDNVVSAGTELRGTPDNVLVKEKGSERE